MWEYNKIEDKWFSKKDTLIHDNYEFLKQEQESVRFYSNCLSGATYIPFNDEDNIYDILSNRRYKTWYIDPSVSDYVNTLVPPRYPTPINRDTAYEFYTKNLSEYGLTLKNLFTPEKIIGESFNSFIYVDLATTDDILDLSANLGDTKIDGVRVLEGHRVLVKDQKKTIILQITTNPDDFFEGNYTVVDTLGTNTTYEYFDERNGIYLVKNDRLVKEDDLDDYQKCIRYSVSVKLGLVNKDKQFHLSRLSNGYYPTTRFNEPIEFVQKENKLLRNQLDYNNIADLNYYDLLKHGTQSYEFNETNYSIPERIISVGEFGSIINNQDGRSNIIRNKFKVDLKSISQTTLYYWIVGNKGNLLRTRKHDFEVDKIELIKSNTQVVSNLNSISFFNDLNGVLVGDNNTIFITSNGGKDWIPFDVKAFQSFNFNKVIFYNTNKIFIGGDNGVFLEIKNDGDKWTAFKRRISKFLDEDDEFLLVDNINDIIITTVDNWNPFYTSFNASESNITITDSPKELVIIVTNDSNIIFYDINESIPLDTDFLFMEFNDKNYGDIVNIERKEGTNTFYFVGFNQETDSNGIFSFSLDDFNSIGVGTRFDNRSITATNANFVSELYPNKLFDFGGNEIVICGNNSLLSSSDYNTLVFEDIDDTFLNKLKSKMLFLDYDIASKLNFFTDDGEYRLPESIEISYDSISGSIEFSSFENETNWIDYWKDSTSTFEHYTNSPMTDTTKIEFSSKFTKTEENVQRFIKGISTSDDDLLKLSPSLYNDKFSRFSSISQPQVSRPLDSAINIYLGSYLMVIKYSNLNDVPSKGDIINVETNFLNENFMVNKTVVFLDNTFVYLYTEFNQSIINMFKNSLIKITNLNRFNSRDSLVSNFKKHPLYKGYDIILNNNGVINFRPKFNNITSYYNMTTSLNLNDGEETFTMEYKNSFLKFGYTPTYNLLDYLESINDINTVNPRFFPTKEYYSMPVYNNIPVSANDINSIYIDYNIKKNNKLVFGSNLEFEWESIFLNTFVNINLYQDEDLSSNEQMLVFDKYYEESTDTYIIEFHKEFIYPNENQVNPLTSIDIESRRSLEVISSDLQLLNNIQRSYSTKKYKSGTFDSGQIWDVEYESLNKKLNFKVNTDSYAKILLSDFTTNNSISGIVYTDFKNELALNITRLEERVTVPILNTSEFQNKLYVSCSQKHELSNGDGVILDFNGGDGSSEELNPQYFGYRVVNVINEFDLVTDINYGNRPLIGTDTGTVRYIRKDPFLNYQPTDLIDVGVDKLGKVSIELNPQNTTLVGSLYSLSNVDYNRFRFRLVDGLDVETLAINYSWIYESEISDAVIGLDNNGLVWYKGRWECGRWFGGTWISGTWLSGDWFDGIWKSKNIKDNFINVTIDVNSDNNTSSVWNTGRWFGGTWENGTWNTGRWYDGKWINGQWFDGLWNGGTWENGIFTSGIWIDGTWNNGRFSTDNGPAYWLGGTWNGGDFDNGIWFNGVFDEKNGVESRFGVKSYNSRASIWKSGKFINGTFHSRLNIDTNGNYDVSEVHKYSIWETGTWFSGGFYGGVAYNIDFRSGVWYGGIVEDINIVGINIENNYITIDKLYSYNIGDQITIIADKTSSFSAISRGIDIYNLGTNEEPGIYSVVNTIQNENTSDIYLDINIQDTVNEQNLDFRSVSRFRNADWRSGLWFNGLFENGIWKGGVWYDGVFSADWS